MSELSRRAFLKRLGYLTAAGVASPLTLNMMGVAEAATHTATDYKALVCVFLDGVMIKQILLFQSILPTTILIKRCDKTLR